MKKHRQRSVLFHADTLHHIEKRPSGDIVEK